MKVACIDVQINQFACVCCTLFIIDDIKVTVWLHPVLFGKREEPVRMSNASAEVACLKLITARCELREVLFLSLSVTLFFVCL